MLRLEARRFVGPAGDVELTPMECAILAYLAGRAGRTVPREELQQSVLGYSPRATSRALDRAVSRLRQKIEVDPAQPRLLVTVYGVGYRLHGDVLGDGGRPGFQGAFVGRLASMMRLRQLVASGEGVVFVAGVPGSGKSRLVAEAVPGARWVDARGLHTTAALEQAVLAVLDGPGARPEVVVLDDASEEAVAAASRSSLPVGALVVTGLVGGLPAQTVLLGRLDAAASVHLVQQQLGRALTADERAHVATGDGLPGSLVRLAEMSVMGPLTDLPVTAVPLCEALWERLTPLDAEYGSRVMGLPPTFQLHDARLGLGREAPARLARLVERGVVERSGVGFGVPDGVREAWESMASPAWRGLAARSADTWMQAVVGEADGLVDAIDGTRLARLGERSAALMWCAERARSEGERRVCCRALATLHHCRPGFLPARRLERLFSACLDARLRMERGLMRLNADLLDHGAADFARLLREPGPERAVASAAEAVRRLVRMADAAGARQWMEVAREAMDARCEPLLKARAHALLARAELALYETERAIEHLEAAKALYGELGSELLLATVMGQLAYALSSLGQEQASHHARLQAQALRSQSGLDWNRVRDRSLEATAEGYEGALDEALRGAREALATAESQGAPTGLYRALLASHLLMAGQPDEAATLLQEAVHELQADGEAYNVGVCLVQLATARLCADDRDGALRAHRQAGAFLPDGRRRGHLAAWWGVGLVLGLPVASLGAAPEPSLALGYRAMAWVAAGGQGDRRAARRHIEAVWAASAQPVQDLERVLLDRYLVA